MKLWIPTIALALSCAMLALPVQAANAGKGKELSAPCVACHGPAGAKPIASMFPVLAGQHEDYLNQAMRAYKSGARKNDVMKAQVEKLSVQDIADLAAYFASQKALEVKR